MDYLTKCYDWIKPAFRREAGPYWLAAVPVALLALKYFTGTRWSKSSQLLQGKSICITGGNEGIGLVTAQEAAKFGARSIVILCRDIKKAVEAEESIKKAGTNPLLTVTTVPCNLASLNSVRDAVKALGTQTFDLLILNAGVMVIPKSTTEDGLETQIGVNHFGHFLLTNLIWKAGLLNNNARVVALSSMAHSIWRSGFDLDDLNWKKRAYSANHSYGASKVANILFIEELQRKFTQEGKGRLAFSVHPGFVRTKLMREQSLMKYILLGLYPLYWAISLSPVEGSQNTLHAATSPDIAQLGGSYFQNLKVTKPNNTNPELGAKLWALSEAVVGLNN